MAHLFKHPTPTNKGLVVFTHKEIGFFTQFWKTTRFGWLNRWQAKLLPPTALKGFCRGAFAQINAHYLVGMHFGWYHHHYPPMPFVDFYMGGKGTVSFQPGTDPFVIPFNSRSFSGSIFTPTEQPKYWDIVCISNNARFKNLDLLLQSIRKLYDLGKPYRVLLLVVSKKLENPKTHYLALEDDYYRLFNAAERERFTLMKLSPNLSFLGLPQSVLAQFLNQSKVFTLFSQREGESRVISEALLCGLPVVVKDDLEGGGRDLLHEKNSVLFSDFGQAHLAFAEAAENPDRFSVYDQALLAQTREDHTLPQLLGYFETLYQRHGQAFDGQLDSTDHLAFRLPGHYFGVPWHRGRFQSADILSKKQFKIFVDHLNLP